METVKDRVLAYARETYHSIPDRPFPRSPGCEVLRHDDSRKLYALLKRVPYDRLGLEGEGQVDLLELRCDPLLRGSLCRQRGYLPAWQAHRENWVTVLLDGTVPLEEILPLLDLSFHLTGPKAVSRT